MVFYLCDYVSLRPIYGSFISLQLLFALERNKFIRFKMKKLQKMKNSQKMNICVVAGYVLVNLVPICHTQYTLQSDTTIVI